MRHFPRKKKIIITASIPLVSAFDIRVAHLIPVEIMYFTPRTAPHQLLSRQNGAGRVHKTRHLTYKMFVEFEGYDTKSKYTAHKKNWHYTEEAPQEEQTPNVKLALLQVQKIKLRVFDEVSNQKVGKNIVSPWASQTLPHLGTRSPPGHKREKRWNVYFVHQQYIWSLVVGGKKKPIYAKRYVY